MDSRLGRLVADKCMAWTIGRDCIGRNRGWVIDRAGGGLVEPMLFDRRGHSLKHGDLFRRVALECLELGLQRGIRRWAVLDHDGDQATHFPLVVEVANHG